MNEGLSAGDHPANFEFWVFEVEDKADLEIGDFEVVEHLSDFDIGDAVDDFGVDDDCAKCDQIRNKF